MSPSNTTMILVPGAWHTADCFTSLSEECGIWLHDRSRHPASVGHEERLPNFSPDIDAIRSSIQGAANAGANVVLVGHFYGSIPSSEARQGLLKKDAAAGQGGVT
ncbi:hypothetical protein DOTSEDRAFT_34991 [Dothistroma septosporum NZE10]|uniref:AB hydrolase-1 domain-containing protein n=1 Tax=Dothistroma septosporum (strain NZE10 / CBS 128990) TaxID=675120 RepID=N1PNU4_DOTSN|nr:hypothetical protein DOTSEDRAFT_34991 [Dothistroma septosporum NZE10]